MCKLFSYLILFLLWLPVSRAAESQFFRPSKLLVPDGFTRAVTYKKIEHLCFQLWGDLDILSAGKALYQQWTEKSGYFLYHFCFLYAAIYELTINPEEARLYLRDDIEVLYQMVAAVEQKMSVSTQEHDYDEIVHSSLLLLNQGKARLKILIDQNIEVG